MSNNGHTTSLRFAALARVSTDRQEQKGESLLTPRNSIERSVAHLGGHIVEWYGGQEHATRGWEHTEVDRMLADAPKKKFDAFIVAFASRWSRDNAKSEEGLDFLRDHGIRYFIGATEMDLSKPSDRLVMGMHGVINQFLAAEQTRLSLENRIARAQRGVPSVGRLPYGRIYDRKTDSWSIDPQKHEIVKEVSARYLQGESLPTLAKEYGIPRTSLFDMLRQQCGDMWTLRFCSKKLNIDETVIIPVPRLLDQKTIRAVHQRLEANRTYLRGHPKNDYLLGGRVFCAECGYTMRGGTVNGWLYYRHGEDAAKYCSLRPRPMVPCRRLEHDVVSKLFDMFGNPAAIKRAVKASIPDCDEALKRRDRVRDDLLSNEKARERVVALVAKDMVTMEQAEAQLRGIRDREGILRKQLDGLEVTLADVPDEDSLKCYVEKIEQSIFVYDQHGNEYAGGNSVASWIAMSDSDKKKLIHAVFNGAIINGKPAGVYVTPSPGKAHARRRWSFVIRGRLEFESVYAASSVGP